MSTIDENIEKLASYALDKGLISRFEYDYSINLLLDVLDLDSYTPSGNEYHDVDLEETLKEILDYAYEKRLIKENSVVYRDLFDTKVMNCFTPRPDSVIATFYYLYENKGAKAATDWFYQFSKDTDYIRSYRVKKDLRWKTRTKYGSLDISINLSKPEKDPKAIAAAKLLKQSSYPRCMLCKENMGYRGRVNHPARETIRIVPLSLGGDDYYLQYSPYSYYNEHCIVFNSDHIPMVIDEKCLNHLLDFVKMFPHYILGSNADLPIVGGSILTHDHYQGGKYVFPMFKAKKVMDLHFEGFPAVKASYLKWPLSVIRIQSKNTRQLLSLALKILNVWRGYTDEASYVYAETEGVPHNTISPICHKIGDEYAFDLVLRNNITTEEFPLGVYHPHQECWHIKKENIGLIEAMGLAVLPSRLQKELALVKKAILEKRDFSSDPEISSHYDWVKEFEKKYDVIDKNNIDKIINDEVGLVFMKVLEYAGVYKRDEKGNRGVLRFVVKVNED